MKVKKATLAFILYVLMITIAYASYQIYSNSVQVTVSAYDFGTLTVDNPTPIRYENLTFSGNLTLNDIGVSDATITLYQNENVIVATTQTDSDGNYVFHWNATEVGTFSFKTGFEVP